MVVVNTAELRKIAEAATPGPWYEVVNDMIGGLAVSPNNKPCSQLDTRNGEGTVADLLNADADATHIATFDPPTILALLDVVEAARTIPLAALGRCGESTIAALARLEALPDNPLREDEAELELERREAGATTADDQKEEQNERDREA
jgi:hypothetical protein